MEVHPIIFFGIIFLVILALREWLKKDKANDEYLEKLKKRISSRHKRI